MSMIFMVFWYASLILGDIALIMFGFYVAVEIDEKMKERDCSA